MNLKLFFPPWINENEPHISDEWNKYKYICNFFKAQFSLHVDKVCI